MLFKFFMLVKVLEFWSYWFLVLVWCDDLSGSIKYPMLVGSAAILLFTILKSTLVSLRKTDNSKRKETENKTITFGNDISNKKK